MSTCKKPEWQTQPKVKSIGIERIVKRKLNSCGIGSDQHQECIPAS